MLLKEKSNCMRTHFIFGIFLLFLFSACSNAEQKSKNNSIAIDSLSKVQQRMNADSLKRINPLLIIPPDSVYSGDYVDKYPNGIIKFRGLFRFGERHGEWMSFYPTGDLWSEMHYERGLREGSNIVYFENGKIRYKGYYKNDKQDSVWTYYDEAGKLAAKVLYNEDRIVKKLPVK